ncbi:MAG: radical SAM protein [Acidobacteria bacterium]|nr:radical SAM protein [Acidobacteriota bacterium]MCA1637217.1 radical SAM protein [Acidobacteriota bacterium]
MRYIANPPNPYHKYDAEFLGEPSPVKLEVFEETATRTIVTKNNSPDVGFNYSVNCYRGCQHGCTYCFARPYHEFLGYGAGTDFETKIVVKINAPSLLKNELRKKSLRGELISFSFTTDPYLPLEANYELTRKCLEACRDFGNPVGIVTKSPLVTRDKDVLNETNKRSGATVYFSIPFLTLGKSKLFEPYAPKPEVRFRAMEELASAGISVGIAIAPIIPSYNDSDIPALLQKARDCGASEAFMTMLRLPTESLQTYFVSRLKENAPTKADKILNQIKRERGGKLNNREFGNRMKGKTEQWQIAEKLFDLHYRRLGFGREKSVKEAKQIFVQQNLFD